MDPNRLRTLFNGAIAHSSQLRSLRSLSSSSSSSAVNRASFFSDESESGSAVYRHTLKFQRPATINYCQQLRNSVNFIGTICHPLKKFNNTYGEFGVHTVLQVKESPESNKFLEILLMMWDEMAEISMEHLKPNDLIHVSGQLGSYTKDDENGHLRTKYKVIVKEINYVAQHGQKPTCQKSVQSESGDEAGMEYYKNYLHLWQVFFANPHEWWDNRKNKVNPKYPDFKHKDTGEVLWLNPKDPPWIKRQLELHDSRLGERLSCRSKVTPLGCVFTGRASESSNRE